MQEALYAYEFDVTTGIVKKDIIDSDGCNMTQALGMKAPCAFDEMVKRSFGNFLRCQYTADSYIKNLSCESLLHAWKCGKKRVEANLYRTDFDQYVRLTYYLAENQKDGHIHAYVICEDITDLERGKGSSVDILTREKNDLTREKNDLTEERDTLTREKHDLTEERDTLTREKRDLTEERDVLTVENIELNQAVDAVHSILKAGSYLCTYNINGEELLGVKYSESLRKLYGYSDENDFPDVWESWMNCIVPEDREYVENSYREAVRDHTGNTTYDVTYRSRKKDGTIRWQRIS